MEFACVNFLQLLITDIEISCQLADENAGKDRDYEQESNKIVLHWLIILFEKGCRLCLQPERTA